MIHNNSDFDRLIKQIKTTTVMLSGVKANLKQSNDMCLTIVFKGDLSPLIWYE